MYLIPSNENQFNAIFFFFNYSGDVELKLYII